MIKSTLCSLPIYYLSLFKMPATVANELEKLQRRFLWGDGEEKKKLHLVNWNKVISSKDSGGQALDLLN